MELTPALLVGTKIDLRNDSRTIEKLKYNKQEPVTFEQGTAKAQELKCVKYLECSAMTRQGIDEVINEAINVVIPPAIKKKKGCFLM